MSPMPFVIRSLQLDVIERSLQVRSTTNAVDKIAPALGKSSVLLYQNPKYQLQNTLIQ